MPSGGAKEKLVTEMKAVGATDEYVIDSLSGKIRRGNGYGSARYRDVAKIANQALFIRHTKSMMMTVSMDVGDYHLEVGVLHEKERPASERVEVNENV